MAGEGSGPAEPAQPDRAGANPPLPSRRTSRSPSDGSPNMERKLGFPPPSSFARSRYSRLGGRRRLPLRRSVQPRNRRRAFRTEPCSEAGPRPASAPPPSINLRADRRTRGSFRERGQGSSQAAPTASAGFRPPSAGVAAVTSFWLRSPFLFVQKCPQPFLPLSIANPRVPGDVGAATPRINPQSRTNTGAVTRNSPGQGSRS